MRWCFWTQMEEFGRMEARVTQVLDRSQATVVSISSARLNGRIFLSGVIDAEEKQVSRVDALLRKIHGMVSVKVLPATHTSVRMIAFIRILCDITDRSEILHFITAVHARTVMIRPMWVAFELVGTPQEIEGVYQSALGYGIADLVSASCVLMTCNDGNERTARAVYDEEPATEAV